MGLRLSCCSMKRSASGSFSDKVVWLTRWRDLRGICCSCGVMESSLIGAGCDAASISVTRHPLKGCLPGSFGET